MNCESPSLFASHSPTLMMNTEWLIPSRSSPWVTINTSEISVPLASKHCWQLTSMTTLPLCRSKLERQDGYGQKHQLTSHVKKLGFWKRRYLLGSVTWSTQGCLQVLLPESAQDPLNTCAKQLMTLQHLFQHHLTTNLCNFGWENEEFIAVTRQVMESSVSFCFSCNYACQHLSNSDL